jgi:hypothetical protein
MISRNVGRAGLSPLTHASMCRRATGVDPKTVRRDKPPDNPEVREEMKAIASKRRRFGYRRIGMLLERKGMVLSRLRSGLPTHLCSLSFKGQGAFAAQR